MGVQTISDNHNVPLNKQDIDNLFFELNKELRKKYRNYPSDYKADLYVVGGACVVARLGSRVSTTDIDAMWTIGDTMRECINAVGDRLGLGHDWCNCMFKQTKSYTSAIITNSSVYEVYDRLIIRMVNLDLLLVMKVVALDRSKPTDSEDINNIVKELYRQDVVKGPDNIIKLVEKYYGSSEILSKKALEFIGKK